MTSATTLAAARPRTPMPVSLAVFVALSVGVLSMLAVLAGVPSLSSILPWRVPVAAITGLCFALLAAALWSAHLNTGRSKALAIGLTVAVAAIGALATFQYVTGRDLGVDRWFFPRPPGSTVMSPQTAAAFLLLSAGLLLSVAGHGIRVAHALVAAAGVLALVNVVDALYGLSASVILPTHIQMALPTALAIVALSVGVAALRPHGTLLELLYLSGAAGSLSRRLMLAAVVIPVIVGWLRLAGERAGWYDGQYGVALVAVSSIVLFAAAVHVTARTIERSDEQRRRAAQALSQALDEATDLYENAPCGYHSVDAEGRFVRVNRTECRWLGYQPAELVGRRRFVDLLTPASRATFQANFPLFKERGEVHDLEFELVRRDGSVLPVLLNATAVRDSTGRFIVSRSTLIDLTARREAEAARETARREAEKASQAKSEFMSRVSHELRTPLNAILGFGQLLEMDGLPAEQAQQVRYISQAGRHLLGLINEMLDIGRIESGQISLSLEPVGLDEVVDDVVKLVGPQADTAGIGIEPPAASRFVVLADRQRLKQILLNLLSNAIKYNKPSGTVTVACQQAGDGRVRVSVIDTGRGIPADRLEGLFVPFDRLGAEQSGIEGTGIGLALSRGLATAMGARLEVESQDGVGTTAWLELPAAAPTAADQQQHAPPPLLARPADRRVVLYVEDNPANLALVERILGERPHLRLVTATSGKSGLALAMRQRPHLILLDVHLPDIPGDEVLRRLKSAPTTSAIPAIAVSADASQRQARRLREAGAYDYLTKPLDVHRLLRAIDRALGADTSSRSSDIGRQTATSSYSR